MNNKKLIRSIIETLAFFDQFEHPLTKEELFRYLWQPPPNSNEANFWEVLETAVKDGKIATVNNFYFLPSREETVKTRLTKTADNDRKLFIAKKAVKKIRYAPFVRAVLVCNNLSFEMSRSNSDIDVVIIVEKGRIWLGRLMVTLILSFYGLRRTKKKTTNKICLSFYATTDNLDFEHLKIVEPDIGLQYWITQFASIYDPLGYHKKLLNKNHWIKKNLRNAFTMAVFSERFKVEDNKFSKIFRTVLEKFWQGAYGDLIESQARAAQKAKMKMNTKSVQNEPDTRVIISDKMLKFHEKDRRAEYRNNWLSKLSELAKFSKLDKLT